MIPSTGMTLNKAAGVEPDLKTAYDNEPTVKRVIDYG